MHEFIVYSILANGKTEFLSRKAGRRMDMFHNAKVKLCASMLIFGSMGLLVRGIALPAGVIALCRGVIGVLFLLCLCSAAKTRVCFPSIRKNAALLLCSGAALGANWIFLFEAYRHTTIAVATLCYYFAPVLIIAVSPFVLKERLTGTKLGCMTASILGMALVSGITGSRGSVSGTGMLFGLAAAASYAGFTLMSKFTKEISSLDATIAQLGVSAIVLFPYVLFTGGFAQAQWQVQNLWQLLILGVVHTGLGFFLFFSSIQRLNAQTAAMLSYIDPVTAILLSMLFLHETMGIAQLAGACLILGAALLSERRKGKTAQTLPQAAVSPQTVSLP